MKKILLSLVISTVLLGSNFCNGMDAKKGSEQKSKSHIVRRDKKKDVDAAERRKSLAAPLVQAATPDEKPTHTKGRTFSLLQKLSAKSKHKSAESGADDIVQGTSAPQAAHSSASEGQEADNLSTLLVLSRTVAPADESGEPKQPAVASKAAETFVQKRMSVKVLVPTSKSGSQQTIFEPREVQVSPAKIDPAPTTMNSHQERLVRRASLLRTVYVTGQQSSDGRAELKRSGRDSMTKFSAEELLGKNGAGALCPNPSPGQSPRTEDTVTPRSEEVTPRTDDVETPRSGEDASSPDHDEAGDTTANDNADKIE